MRSLFHPAVQEVTVEGILHALADPVRMAIFTRIAASTCPQTCSHFLQIREREIPKSTLSQHFKVLRESGLIHSERQGTEMRNRSRCAEIDRRFPGLIPAIVAAYQAQPQRAAGRRRARA